jgi:hypothetical protein
MKLTHLLGAGLLVAAGNSAFALDFVRQTQVINGNSVVTDQTVESMQGQTVKGRVTSTTLTSDLSIFQLWASYTDASSITSMLKLDEKSIGTFLPKVSITTASEDPHIPTRTRADRPYSMTVSVSGMLSGASVPDYAQRILFGRGYKEYSTVTLAPTGVTGLYPNSNVYYSNGTYSITGIYQQLPGGMATNAVGAETFTASIQPEAGTTLGQLASAEVIVWPVASSAIIGIESGRRYFGFPKTGNIILTNAYPTSTTYAQIYKGSERLGTVGIVIPDSTRVYNTDTPQNATISTLDLESLSEQLPEDGIYTVTRIETSPSSGLALLTLEDESGSRLVPADAGPTLRALRAAGIQSLPVSLVCQFDPLLGTLVAFDTVEEA